MVYLIGSLRNPEIPNIANRLRDEGFDVFDDWFAAGEHADDIWQAYEQNTRKRTFAQALKGKASKHVYEFDRENLDAADTVVLVMPAGKSGHLELGWALGRGKKGYILMEGEPERFDVMYRFSNGVFYDIRDLVIELRKK